MKKSILNIFSSLNRKKSEVPPFEHSSGDTFVLNDSMAAPRNNFPASPIEKTVLLNPEKDKAALDATVLLMPDHNAEVMTREKTACLIRIKNQEHIILNKPVFLIGRNRNDLDYSIQDNLHVGHKHVSVTKRGNAYFITDLNSINHTYLNGTKIQSSMETELTDGDIVRLADEEFTFRLM